VEELHPPLSHSEKEKERGRVEELYPPLSHSQREKGEGEGGGTLPTTLPLPEGKGVCG